ncbi:4-amino-4-deoxychorismate lyase [Synechococcus sp. BS56D]|uniref:aminotransferase class IV n=1 Tax=Synechococcus sp. BS56D TaxID=2055944 RepID=UPI00103C43BC|nr:aminotransferase class IV [Synechococcus sp. BS56D]TCD59015.1 4-amino-4-deoxychorismate lyase [Synechococcus sp. BS56D]
MSNLSAQSSKPESISWCNGRWGSAKELGVPLSDRGLLLADGLFETVLVQAGKPRLLEDHLQRWQTSAALLAMAPPPEADWLKGLITEAIDRCGLSGEGNECSGALRLNWSRGDGDGRGIELPTAATDPSQHRFWLTLQHHTPTFSPVRCWISRHERRNATSQLSRCKTFAYGQAIQARREARTHGADDALLLSSKGDLCCGSTANLLVLRQGTWITPPLSSGCLPGIMRARALTQPNANEEQLGTQPQPGDQWLLINSLGCRPLAQVDDQPLNVNVASAQALWRNLLD